MADKHYDVRELKLGPSFTNNKAATQYHTIKYDFKPASVDVNKMATVDVGTNNQVTVTVPHLDGAGVPQTVFKGNQRPYTKECVLIIDRVTGEITLEKLSSNIQVKKTRAESHKPWAGALGSGAVGAELTNTTQRSTSRTRVTTNRRVTNTVPGVAQPNNVPRFNGNTNMQKTPPTMVRSPQRFKSSPPQAAPWAGGNSTLKSLPMIGLEDAGPAQQNGFAHTSHMNSSMSNSNMSNSHMSTNNHMSSNSHMGTNNHMNTNNHMSSNSHMSTNNGYPAPRPERHAPERHHTPHNMPNVLSSLPQLPAQQQHQQYQQQHLQQQQQHQLHQDSSSSSSSDSDSDSGSDSDDNDRNGASGNPEQPGDMLEEDLLLSESGSDSD